MDELQIDFLLHQLICCLSPHRGSKLPAYYSYPELLCGVDDIHIRAKNFCGFCTVFIPVPGTSVSSVRPCYNTRGTGTTFFYLRRTFGCAVRRCRTSRNICEFCTTFIPVYPELLKVIYDIQPRTRNLCEFCTPVPQYPELV